MGNKFLLGLYLFGWISIANTQEITVKCGTGRYISAMMESPDHLFVLSTPRPALQKSELTPSGKFRIHYDTIGNNIPILLDSDGIIVPNSSVRNFVDTLKHILDSVWNAEVIHFGFPAPSGDENRGGGKEYDIYIVDLGSGWFGETVPEYDFPLDNGKTNRQYTSFIRVDNDFGFGFRTKGISALKVTIAHEFQHAIQVSGTGLWTNDFYFYELCAEAFEPIVFPDVKDYIHDVKTYFADISAIPLFSTSYPGYERAIFGLFLMKRFGTRFMVDLWEEIRTTRPIPALNKMLLLRSTTLEKEYGEFSDWIFFSNTRADSINYFHDAALFPPPKYHSTIVANNVVQIISGNAKTFSTHFIRTAHGNDSTHFILSVTNVNDVVNNQNQNYLFQMRLSLNPDSDLLKIRPNLYFRFDPSPVSDNQYWKVRVQTSEGPYIPSSFVCFPNPYEPKKGLLYFNTDIPVTAIQQMFIYTSTMDLVYAGDIQSSYYSGKLFAAWNGRDNVGNLAPSGIYFYYLTNHTKTIHGKFAIIR